MSSNEKYYINLFTRNHDRNSLLVNTFVRAHSDLTLEQAERIRDEWEALNRKENYGVIHRYGESIWD
ncbi:hypothetical protein CYR83_04195 [Ligilactobacillus agilis]|uniref:Uncharacterized protein n=1 Tax=Ligilactobacillus agilis TaxID=1601 RepID=A0A2I2ACI8_9LACO|nr:hypothetical protein [Ligilactobacillus agilis]PLA77080.1 hypothetical protein CYR79_02810 [Ligilactobacillus agilis]PLA83313.1 hypothetical protein CYR83_04195 [Ligilactobacillus agilis]